MSTINYLYDKSFSPGIYRPALDPKGTSTNNRVYGEIHTLSKESNNNYHVIIPLFSPFFSDNLILEYISANNTVNRLVEGIDYVLAYQFLGASRGCLKPIYGGISILNNKLEGKVKLTYQALGGDWYLNLNKINEVLSNQIQNPRITSWEQVTASPNVFPVIDHEWNLTDLVGVKDIVKSIDILGQKIASRSIESMSSTQLETIIIDHSSRLNTVFEKIDIFSIIDIATKDKLKIPTVTDLALLFEDVVRKNYTTSFYTSANELVTIFNATLRSTDYSRLNIDMITLINT